MAAEGRDGPRLYKPGAGGAERCPEAMTLLTGAFADLAKAQAIGLSLIANATHLMAVDGTGHDTRTLHEAANVQRFVRMAVDNISNAGLLLDGMTDRLMAEGNKPGASAVSEGKGVPDGG